MKGLMGFVGATIASTIGWYVGGLFGVVAAFLVSTIAGGFGMYYGAKWARNTFG